MLTGFGDASRFHMFDSSGSRRTSRLGPGLIRPHALLGDPLAADRADVFVRRFPSEQSDQQTDDDTDTNREHQY
jgi:hypothetical protein